MGSERAGGGSPTETQTQLWIPLVAALGAAVLTGLASVGAVIFQARLQQADNLRHERRHAYSQLLATSAVLAHTSHTLHLARETRSGLSESFEVAFRLRKLLDVFDLDARMRQDLVPLYAAWSEVWTVGTQEAIRAGNAVVSAAIEVIERGTVRGAARGRVATRLLGERWTRQQLDEWDRSIQELAGAREELVAAARAEFGLETVELMETGPPNLG